MGCGSVTPTDTQLQVLHFSPRFLSKLECCWSRDWHSLTHLPQWPMNLSEPAEIMATPWRHCWTVGQDRKRLDWWRSQTKKKLCRLSCRGSLVWFTGRWKVKLLLFNGTGYKTPIAGYIWVNFNNLEREKIHCLDFWSFNISKSSAYRPKHMKFQPCDWLIIYLC